MGYYGSGMNECLVENLLNIYKEGINKSLGVESKTYQELEIYLMELLNKINKGGDEEKALKYYYEYLLGEGIPILKYLKQSKKIKDQKHKGKIMRYIEDMEQELKWGGSTVDTKVMQVINDLECWKDWVITEEGISMV